MFIGPRGQQMFGAPAERNVLIDEYVEHYFRSAGAKNPIDPEVL